MANSKIKALGGLQGIVNTGKEKPEPVAAQAAAAAAMTPKTGNYKTVCYSIPPALAAEVDRIAKEERRTKSAIVSEAFEMLINSRK